MSERLCCCTCVDCRTDCIFSPDDRLVITGTSVKKGAGVGKLVFLDRQTLKIAAELDVAAESASSSCLCIVRLTIIRVAYLLNILTCYVSHCN